MRSGLHPIPSVINLPEALEASGVGGSEQLLKRRGVNAGLQENGKFLDMDMEKDKISSVGAGLKEVKRYDADGVFFAYLFYPFFFLPCLLFSQCFRVR